MGNKPPRYGPFPKIPKAHNLISKEQLDKFQEQIKQQQAKIQGAIDKRLTKISDENKAIEEKKAEEYEAKYEAAVKESLENEVKKEPEEVVAPKLTFERSLDMDSEDED